MSCVLTNTLLVVLILKELENPNKGSLLYLFNLFLKESVVKVINLSEIREKRNREKVIESLEDITPITFHFYNDAAKIIYNLSSKMLLSESDFIKAAITLINDLTEAQERGSEIVIRERKTLGFLSIVTKERKLRFAHLEKQKQDLKKLVFLKYLDRFKPRK